MLDFNVILSVVKQESTVLLCQAIRTQIQQSKMLALVPQDLIDLVTSHHILTTVECLQD